MFNGAGGIAGSFIIRNFEAPAYTTAVWISIGYVACFLVFTSQQLCWRELWTLMPVRSHILMISVVAALTVHFYFANRSQNHRSGVLENTVCPPGELYWDPHSLTWTDMTQEGFRFTY